MKKTLRLTSLLFLFFFQYVNAQTTRTVGTYSELTAAVTASADGDIINFSNNIVADAEIVLSKTLILNGNGYRITVPVPGLDEAGKFNSNPSAFRIFNLSGSGKTVTINHLKISGGSLTAGSGAAIYVGSGNVLNINNSTISHSRGDETFSVGGGGLHNNGGTVFMKGCQVIRNAAAYGGGFLNSGNMFVENSTFSENRSTSLGGGGGAGENGFDGYLYVNNSTFSNNKSTEIGGAINNYTGTLYIVNSSLTGNVAYGDYHGGAIGNNGGSVYAVNSLFAYNYHRSAGDVTNPTGYVPDDVEAFSDPGNVHLYYCIYHADLTSSGVDYSSAGNVHYTGIADGSDNTIFSGGASTRITDGAGNEIGTGLIFQPFLYNNGEGIAPTLQTGSFTLDPANLGTKTGFTSNSGSPVVGYYNRATSAWVNLVGSAASSYEITTDQVGATRSDPPAIGAIQGTVDNLYMLKVNYSADGSVTGGTVYGDVYPSGTSVTLTAIPVNNKLFDHWEYVLGGTGTASTDNPYDVLVDRNITLIPVFINAAGSYSITYTGNGNTGGTAPATGTFNGSTNLEGAGNLTRSGYIFDGWNTSPNGSGTSYAVNDEYTAGVNLTLYAQWKDNFWRGASGTDYATAANWGAGIIPGADEDIVFAEDAVNDLILDQNRQVNNIQFSGAPYKLVLGNFNLTAHSVTNFSSTSYVQSNGTGRFSMNIEDGIETLFPVGRSAYNPVSVKNNTGAADAFGILVLDELYLNGYDEATVTEGRVKRTWDITKTNPNAGAGVDFIFNWNAGEAENVTTPALFHYSGGWTQQTAGTTSSTATSLTYTGYTGTFSPFGVADINATLPVTWLSFTVQKQNGSALIAWATAAETNNKDFVVEHSINGWDWESIAVIKGAANSVAVKNYEYLHTNPAEGKNYYRIRQRDYDGKSSFSSIQSLQFETKTMLSVYPNPVVNGTLHLRTKKAGMLTVYTSNGQLVLRKKLDVAGQHSINMQSLSKGTYRLAFEQEIVSIILQ
ncbi:MAG: InlB B-repeat-containing protein [Chitinophagaceae bacterium]|nr:InlB B-repeat-containing protein [Chitinophagaceae bacterium]